MIEKIDLAGFELCSNKILVKADKNYDMLVIDGPEGKKVELQLISFGETEANHYSISGTLIKRPEETFFFDKTTNCSQKEFQSCMLASLSVDCDYDFKEGDKIFYNYNVQLSAEAENRLVDTEEYGICMLVNIDMVFGYVKDDELVPVNGYVFFNRDKEIGEYETESGLTIINEVKAYANQYCTVIAADKPVRGYMDTGNDSQEIILKGDRILIDKRFGYKMAYDLHGGDVKDVEVCYRKHIIGKFDLIPD